MDWCAWLWESGNRVEESFWEILEIISIIRSRRQSLSGRAAPIIPLAAAEAAASGAAEVRAAAAAEGAAAEEDIVFRQFEI